MLAAPDLSVVISSPELAFASRTCRTQSALPGDAGLEPLPLVARPSSDGRPSSPIDTECCAATI
jgi:hypothetical protein